ncbi:MAG: hypothetical protein IJS15_12980, partial [Victivallales bacterium]|nr:hypothetical protein [Victivallales bacterium]
TTQVPAKEAVVETTQVPAKEAVAETTQSTAAETVAKTLQVPAKAEVAETTQSTAATPALVADDGARLETSDKRDTSDTRDGELDGAASQTVTIATTTQVTAAETVIQKTQVTAAETVAETTQSTAATPAVVAAPQVAAPPDAAAVNVASNESQTSESPVSVSQADVESVSEADSSLPDEEAADDEPVSIMDINAQLMQASVTDLDDEADPALADTGESALMASYTPPVVHEKLMEQLSEMGGDYARIGEAIANLLPHALGQYGLTLLCEQNRMSANDLMLLSDDTTLQQLNQAYKALHLSGSVKISYSQDGHGRPHVRYKPASFMDMNRIRANEFVIKANKILGTQVTEGRVPDNRQQEMK